MVPSAEEQTAKTFMQAMETRRVVIQGVEILLELNERVFAPSPNGSFYGEQLRIHPGDHVIDIGTGSGVLAIFAAKRGAVVSATDTDAEAIELAGRNARSNQVEIELKQGSMFGSFERRFDVILANLPNEIVNQDYIDAIGAELARTMDGGDRGNKYILELLITAHRHMHEGSRLYLPIHTLTDYKRTIEEMLKSYQAKLVGAAELPAKEFVEKNLESYLDLNQEGVIRIFKRDGKWYSEGYIFELSLKANDSQS